GVGRAIFVGGPGSAEARLDRGAAAEAGLDWEALEHPAPSAAVARMEQAGPFYLYGGITPDLTGAIASRFGPVMPPRVTDDAGRLLASTAPRAEAKSAAQPATHPAAPQAAPTPSLRPPGPPSRAPADRATPPVSFLGKAVP